MSRRTGLGISIAVLASAIAVAVFAAPPLFGNLYSLLTDGGSSGYFIPAESSVLTFVETEANSGSGGWWMRGEDRTNLYAVIDDEPGYVVFPKAARERCAGFVETDPSSWCPMFRKRSGR